MASKNMDASEANHAERFSDVEENPLKKLMPIQGYAEKPLVSLEEAVEPLVDIVHDVKKMAAWAKWQCKEPPSDGLTIDQSAAITLYSMEWLPQEKCLYFVLNAALRDENRQRLKPWFLYLKLFLVALSRLPPIHRTVYRGIKRDLRKDYKKGQTVLWWGFSSCTLTMDILNSDQFLGQKETRTLFAIECSSGRDIRQHSAFQHEDEILLMAARQFQVVSCMPQGENLFIVQLKEVQSPISLLELEPEAAKVSDVNQSISSPKISLSGLNIQPTGKITPQIPTNARWVQNGVTVAGGNGKGGGLHQLNGPIGLDLDENRTIYIADCVNDRIVAWKSNAKTGELVAGGNGSGNRLDQLSGPSDVILDGENLIVCDTENRRIMQWPRENGKKGEIIVPSTSAMRLTIDTQGFLYAAESSNHVVQRYRMGEPLGTVVAGHYNAGKSLEHLSWPTFMHVDEDYSIYISDNGNHRVMKWKKNAEEGTIVAGGNQNNTNHRARLSNPDGLIVDSEGTMYIADNTNHRVLRWYPGAEEGEVIVGGKGQGHEANQLRNPQDLAFDSDGNLYVVDWGNHRVQRFDIK